MPVAAHRRALEALRAGQIPLALREIESALNGASHLSEWWGLKAHILHRMGRIDDAWQACDAALRLNAEFFPALVEGAQLQLRRGDDASRLSLLERAHQLQPAQISVLLDLAQALTKSDPQRALRLLVGLPANHPQATTAHLTRAIAHQQLKQFEQAVQHYAAAAPGLPNDGSAWINWADSLIALNRFDESLAVARRALELNPNSARALDALAWSMQNLNAPGEETLPLRKRIVDLEPNATRWSSLGHNQLKVGDFPAAKAAFREALKLDPDSLPSKWALFQYPDSEVFDSDTEVAEFLLQWESGLAEFEAMDFSTPESAARMLLCGTLSTNFYLHYTGVNVTDLQIRYGRLLERGIRAALPPLAPFGNRTHTRPRIGFASTHFRRHTVCKLFGPMIRSLQNSAFDLYLYNIEGSRAPEWQALTHGATKALSASHDVATWSQAIRDDDLDVLIYTDIGMHPKIQCLAAQRLARTQAMWWGHPITFGASSMDVFLTNALMEPPDGNSHYAEQLHRLPGIGVAFDEPDTAPADVSSFAPRRDGEFRCFLGQSASKLLPWHDAVLADIAERIPEATFHLIPHFVESVRIKLGNRMRRVFEQRGLDFDRHVVMHPFQSEANFMGLASSCDLNLDSIGWSGGNTTLEITWCEVPTVTWPGAFMRSRHTAAILTQVGLPELIAHNREEYLQIVVRLARDAGERVRLRAHLHEHKYRLYRDQKVIEAFHRWLREVTAHQFRQ